MKKILFMFAIVAGLATYVLAEPSATIIKLNGDVKIRRGMEENWENAQMGQELDDIDTILSLEGNVVLEIRENLTFTMGSNTMLDIGDLRRIQEQELFLYLMEKKLDQIKPRTKKTPLRIGNISAVHGLKAGNLPQPEKSQSDDAQDWWRKETNGAQALLNQKYYPNTIVKTHKILTKYPEIDDCGEVHFYLARSLEAIGKTGQAIEAYQTVIKRCREKDCKSATAQERLRAAKSTVKRLKQ
jgi:TolA-binding protein